MPYVPYPASTPQPPNLPFPHECNWSYNGEDYREQMSVVPTKKREEEPEEKKGA